MTDFYGAFVTDLKSARAIARLVKQRSEPPWQVAISFKTSRQIVQDILDQELQMKFTHLDPVIDDVLFTWWG